MCVCVGGGRGGSGVRGSRAEAMVFATYSLNNQDKSMLLVALVVAVPLV